MKCAAKISLSLLLVFLPAIGRSQEFSAEVVYPHNPRKQDSQAPGGTAVPASPSATVHVSKEMMRFEGGGENGLIMLVDLARHTTLILFPWAKSYRQVNESRATGYFSVADAENACPDWQKKVASEIPCEKIGNDVVDGRNAVKYKSAAQNGSSEYVWVDPKLHLVIKWDTGNAGAELRNIKEGPQAADLFVIPQDYGPFKPPRKKSKATRQPK